MIYSITMCKLLSWLGSCILYPYNKYIQYREHRRRIRELRERDPFIYK